MVMLGFGKLNPTYNGQSVDQGFDPFDRSSQKASSIVSLNHVLVASVKWLVAGAIASRAGILGSILVSQFLSQFLSQFRNQFPVWWLSYCLAGWFTRGPS